MYAWQNAGSKHSCGIVQRMGYSISSLNSDYINCRVVFSLITTRQFLFFLIYFLQKLFEWKEGNRVCRKKKGIGVFRK